MASHCPSYRTCVSRAHPSRWRFLCCGPGATRMLQEPWAGPLAGSTRAPVLYQSADSRGLFSGGVGVDGMGV